MCSLPFPDAIESATSNSDFIEPASFSFKMVFRESKSFDVSILIISHFAFWGNFSVEESFIKIIFSASNLFRSAVICP